jgi:hypothetical protein
MKLHHESYPKWRKEIHSEPSRFLVVDANMNATVALKLFETGNADMLNTSYK